MTHFKVQCVILFSLDYHIHTSARFNTGECFSSSKHTTFIKTRAFITGSDFFQNYSIRRVLYTEAQEFLLVFGHNTIHLLHTSQIAQHCHPNIQILHIKV